MASVWYKKTSLGYDAYKAERMVGRWRVGDLELQACLSSSQIFLLRGPALLERTVTQSQAMPYLWTTIGAAQSRLLNPSISIYILRGPWC